MLFPLKLIARSVATREDRSAALFATRFKSSRAARLAASRCAHPQGRILCRPLRLWKVCRIGGSPTSGVLLWLTMSFRMTSFYNLADASRAARSAAAWRAACSAADWRATCRASWRAAFRAAWRESDEKPGGQLGGKPDGQRLSAVPHLPHDAPPSLSRPCVQNSRLRPGRVRVVPPTL